MVGARENRDWQDFSASVPPGTDGLILMITLKLRHQRLREVLVVQLLVGELLDQWAHLVVQGADGDDETGSSHGVRQGEALVAGAHRPARDGMAGLPAIGCAAIDKAGTGAGALRSWPFRGG